MNQFSRLLLFLLFQVITFQNYAQELVVHCADALTTEDLEGVTLLIKSPQKTVTTSTNHQGICSIEAVAYPATIQAHCVGYEQVMQILTEPPKQVLELALVPNLISCPVIVRAPGTPFFQPDLLRRDEALRLPAMFFDPARVAATRPGVLQANDGTNALSVHGLHPELVRWRIHELDIVNPNHLPNAGTFNDRAAQGGGGVFLVNSQAIGASRWYAGDLPTGVGDAVAALLDIHLRDGGNHHRRTVQAGLLGLDAALDGSFRNTKWRYLANYRYSTVGLLSKLGVSFGDEAIAFQDLNCNLTYFGQYGRQVRFFALAGQSTNDFEGDTTKSTLIARDFATIHYRSRTGITGVDAILPMHNNYTVALGAAASVQHNHRSEIQPLYLLNFDEKQTESRLSTKGRLSKRWYKTGEMDWTTGWNSSYLRLRQIPDSATVGLGTLIFQPYSALHWSRPIGGFFEQFQGGVGLHNLYISAIDAFEPQPRLKLSLNKRTHTWSADVSRLAQMPLYTNLLIPHVRQQIQPIRAWMYSLGHQWTHHHFSQFFTKARVFYQSISRVPLADQTGIETPVEGSNISRWAGYGSGRSYGTDLTLGTNRDQDFSYSANLSLFNTTLIDLAGKPFNTRYNTGFVCNLIAERSWEAMKARGKRTRSLSGRVVVAGGQRYAPVSDVQTTYLTRYDLRRYGTQRGPVYFRTDVRYQRILQRSPHLIYTLAFEVQNLSFTRNLDYYYFEPLTMTITKKYQLGMIPNLNWKVEF